MPATTPHLRRGTAPDGVRSTVTDLLHDAAWGARPGLDPLPPAAGPRDAWHRAVALGGRGHHAAATAALDPLRRRRGDVVLASLATSTQASLWRQLGGHAAARVLDGRALALVAGVPGRDAAVARADALTGLAADALGGPVPGTAHRLLADAARETEAATTAPAPTEPATAVPATAVPSGADVARLPVRLGWVRAETALRLDDPAAAVGHARGALALAEAGESVRHRVKSTLVLAAALAAREPAEAVVLAGRARDGADEHGLLPLGWAANLLLAALADGAHGAGGAGAAGAAAAAATRSSWIITLRGGLLPTTRRGRGAAARSAAGGAPARTPRPGPAASTTGGTS